jgi:UDP-glucose 4-epimerase
LVAGCGFLGSHVAEELCRADCLVRILDRREPPPHLFRHLPFVRGDIGDGGILQKALEDVSTVVYAAGMAVPSTRDVRFDIESNVLTFVDFLEECTRARVKRVIYFSSGGAVYGQPQRIPISEEHPTDPISAYGASKLMLEKYLGVFHAWHGLDYCVLRVSNAYGERQAVDGKQGVIPTFLHKLERGERLHVWGDGTAVKDYVYVGDVARAVIKYLEHDATERLFNIGSGRGLSIQQLLDVISRVTRRRIDVQYGPPRPFDVPTNILDCRRAEREWGWRASVSIDEGVRRSWDWIRSLRGEG